MIGLRGLNLLIGIVSLNITFRVKTFWEALYLNLQKSCAKLLLCLKRYSVIPLHLLQICESFEDCFHWCIFSCLLALSIFELSLVPFWLSLFSMPSQFESVRSLRCFYGFCLIIPEFLKFVVSWKVNFAHLLLRLSVLFKFGAYPQLYPKLYWVQRRLSLQ